MNSSFHPSDDIHQFGDLAELIRLVPARNRVFYAMRDMILQDFFFCSAQGGTNRRDLGDDFDAVAVFLDHFGQPADLAFDTAETFLHGYLDVFLHAPHIPLLGIGFK
jgi:hypothetical protein